VTKVVLITAQPRNPTTAAVATVKLAGGGNAKPYPQGFRAGVANRPRFKAKIGFSKDGWTGSVIPTTGGVNWAPAGKAALNELAAYFWPGAAITIEEGEEGAAAATRLAGKVAEATVKDDQLAITFADLGEDLNKPLITARFAGTGGAEGIAEAKGRIKRRTWGRAFNIEGRILDKANNVYEFGDPAFPWQSFDVLRDKGRAASPAPAVIAWQGSVAATLGALAASAPAQGSGVVAPSIACAKWWTQPAGPLTADVRGEIGAGYVETAPEIAARVLAAAAGPAITNAATAAGWRAGTAGIHVGEDETIAAVLDRLLMGVSLLWIFNPAGTITLRELTWSGPVETLRSDRVERLETFAPVKKRRLGYQRAYRSHSDGEIAASLLQLDPAAGGKLDGIEQNADVTRSVGYGPSLITIAYNSDGSAKSGQLPRAENYKLFKSGVEVPAGVTASYKVVSWTVNGFTNASGPQAMPVAGALATLSTTSLGTNKAVIEITMGHAGVSAVGVVDLIKAVDTPPSSGGGGGGGGGGSSGTSQSDPSLAAFSSSATVISDELTITLGASNTAATLSGAYIDLLPEGGGTRAPYNCQMWWERWNGSTWVTHMSAGLNGGAAFDSDFDPFVYNEGGGIYGQERGSISVGLSWTGLTAGSTQKFRLVAQAGATWTTYPTGTVGAAG